MTIWTGQAGRWLRLKKRYRSLSWARLVCTPGLGVLGRHSLPRRRVLPAVLLNWGLFPGIAYNSFLLFWLSWPRKSHTWTNTTSTIYEPHSHILTIMYQLISMQDTFIVKEHICIIVAETEKGDQLSFFLMWVGIIFELPRAGTKKCSHAFYHVLATYSLLPVNMGAMEATQQGWPWSCHSGSPLLLGATYTNQPFS